MADPRPLTRDQLAKFLPDAEAIKRFERLFTVAGDLTPADVVTLFRLAQEVTIETGTASASAQSALDQLAQIVQDAAVNTGATDDKASAALEALSSIAQSLEMLALAPIAQGYCVNESILPPTADQSLVELADTSITSVVAGDVLIYDATLKVWKNALLVPGTNVTITNADGSITINASSTAVEIHAATSKATPVDADEMPLADSAAMFALKKLTWANLKATLATWIGGNLIAGSFTSLVSSTTGKVASTLGVGNATPAASGAGITFPATESLSSDANTLDHYVEGSYTATATGMTTSPTGTVTFTVVGNVVTIDIPVIEGTSNSGAFSLTGMPAIARPANGKQGLCYVKDAGVLSQGSLYVNYLGTIEVYKSAGGFTAVGTKGISYISFTYTKS